MIFHMAYCLLIFAELNIIFSAFMSIWVAFIWEIAMIKSIEKGEKRC